VSATATESELQAIAPGAHRIEEAGLHYIFLPGLRMPKGCTPEVVDCLLCLDSRDGYPTRLFFATQVSAPGKSLNWNGAAHILGRNWVAYSWKDAAAPHPVQILLGHLDALR
jgi:hypothetical protein